MGYIYKDGIRVLPYGDTDYDFVEIEKNRTKSAGYYYFSYRRIFGTIAIDQTRNANPVEKAGREGFRQNRAYRQFRELFMNFFVQIAADFFRKGGVHVATFEEQKAELGRLELIKRRRDRLVSVRRKQVREGLDDFFRHLDEGTPQRRVADVLENLKDEIQGLAEILDPNRQASELLAAELRARREIRSIREESRIARPRGVGLSREVRQSWEAYRGEFLKLEEICFGPAESEIAETIRHHVGC